MTYYCCKEFEKMATTYPGTMGPGLYPPSEYPKAQFVPLQDGLWAINGCCGGGCYVVTDMEYCPFCGVKLKKEMEK